MVIRPLRLFTAGALFVILLSLAYVAHGATIPANGNAAVYAAAKAAKPGDAVQATGLTGTLDLSNIAQAAPGVTIAAPGQKVDRLVLSGTLGLNVTGLEVAVTPSWMSGVYAINCQRIALDKVHLHTADGSLTQSGLMFRNCSDAAITNSELDHLGVGGAALDSSSIRVVGNSFHDLDTDGWDMACVTTGLVDANTFTNFYPSVGAHPDAVQGYCTTPGGSQSDITVRGNVITRGAGKVMQGVFFESTKNLIVTGNAMSGPMFNGIGVSTTATADIGPNFVQGWTDDCGGQQCATRIITRGASSNVTVHDSAAQAIVQVQDGGKPNPGYKEINNTIIPPAAPGDYTAMNAWILAHGGPTPPVPPICPVDPQIAILKAQVAALTAQVASLQAQNAALTTTVANDTAAFNTIRAALPR